MGPIGVFWKASTLQDYGVDKFFVLENDNVDSSQRNIVFLAHGENAEQIISITGRHLSVIQNTTPNMGHGATK